MFLIQNLSLGFKLVNVHKLTEQSFSSHLLLHSLSLRAPMPLTSVRVSYLEEGAVALQPGGAEGGDGAQAAPEVDA